MTSTANVQRIKLIIKKKSRASVLRDGDISFRASVFLLITAGSQSETMDSAFVVKKPLHGQRGLINS